MVFGSSDVVLVLYIVGVLFAKLVLRGLVISLTGFLIIFLTTLVVFMIIKKYK